MIILVSLFLSILNSAILCSADNAPIKELLSYEPALITIANRFSEPLIVKINSTGLNDKVIATQLAFPETPEASSHMIQPNTNNSLRFWKLIHRTPEKITLLSTLWIHIYHSPQNPSGKPQDYCGAGAYFEVDLANPPRQIVACKDEQRLKVYQEY